MEMFKKEMRKFWKRQRASEAIYPLLEAVGREPG